MQYQNYEYSQVILNKPKPFFTKKKIVVFCVILLVCFFMASLYRNAKYKIDLSNATSLIVEGAIKAEDVCVLTKKVWYNSIFKESDEETDKYTKTNGEFNDDFNDSLKTLFTDSDIKSDVNFVIDNRTYVNAAMGKLLNPPQKYKDAYSKIQALYESYLDLAQLATSPKGNYYSYTENYDSTVSEFVYNAQIIQQYIS